MLTIDRISSPQLEKIHSGKVRESFRIDENSRLIVVSDRISGFDKKLRSQIPYKGAVLNGISNFWFAKTKHIIDNHLISQIDPNINMVKEAEPIRIEMIVRGYLTGSMWRNYKKGNRTFSGISVEDSLTENQKFPNPLLTPTTKEETDREISPENIVAEGWTTKELYEKMAAVSLELFEFGTKYLAENGIILVDTKYEFGLVNGHLVLIDEIHTPDSSRFWSAELYDKNPLKVESMDKEFVRQWLLANKKNDNIPDELPENVIMETTNRYLDIYRKITKTDLEIDSSQDVDYRIYQNLLNQNIIKDGYVIIFMGSPTDVEHCKKIKEVLEKYDVFVKMRVVSAHKNGERLPELVQPLNESIEPGCAIAVAGRSNGLGGALATNLVIPLINCPPFKDKTDMLVNINSSLVMPSNTPATTAIDIGSAALAALRSLNLQRLKKIFVEEIAENKRKLVEADDEIKEM
jgi:phosphoribosylaminoimidazole-succinocarboxamide synthase